MLHHGLGESSEEVFSSFPSKSILTVILEGYCELQKAAKRF